MCAMSKYLQEKKINVKKMEKVLEAEWLNGSKEKKKTWKNKIWFVFVGFERSNFVRRMTRRTKKKYSFNGFYSFD